MQSRCCWPPDMPNAFVFSRSLTSSQSAPRLQRPLDDLVHVALHARARAGRRRCCRRSTSGTGSASGTPSRSACAPAPGRRRRRRGPRRGRGSAPLTVGAGIRSFIRLRQRISVVLPQPDGPISAVISLLVDVEGDVPHRRLAAVADRDVLQLEDRLGRRSRRRDVARHRRRDVRRLRRRSRLAAAGRAAASLRSPPYCHLPLLLVAVSQPDRHGVHGQAAAPAARGCPRPRGA